MFIEGLFFLSLISAKRRIREVEVVNEAMVRRCLCIIG